MLQRAFTIIGIAFPLGRSIILAWRAWRTAVWCRRASADLPHKLQGYPHISILLPVLREQTLVHDTLRSFTALEYPQESVQIVVVTTDRETSDLEQVKQAIIDRQDGLNLETLESITAGKLNQAGCEQLERALLAGADNSELLDVLSTYRTTAAVAREVLAEHSCGCRIRQVHYTGTVASKAAQLNYAVAQLEPPWNAPDAYVGVFDFDSRPHVQSLQFVASAIQQHAPEALQQPAIAGLNSAATNAGGIADSLLHILRTFGVEAYSWRAQRNMAQRKCLSLLGPDFYFVGSGLYVQLAALRAAGGFPHPVDDIPLGFYAARHGWRTELVPVNCLMQAYPSLSAAVSSRILVYFAYAQALADFLRAPLPLRWRLATIVEGVVWAFGPLLWLLALGNATRQWGIKGGISALLTYIGAAAVKLLTGFRIYRMMQTEFTTHLSLQAIVLGLFHPCWRSISALRLFSKLVRQLFTAGRRLAFQKTER